MSGWNDERIDLLKKLWGDGRSAGQISKQLACGISRAAVCGKVHRLGLPERLLPSAPQRLARGLVDPGYMVANPLRAPPVKRAPKAANGIKARKVKPAPVKIAGNSASFDAPAPPPVLAPIPHDRWAPLPGTTPRPFGDRGPAMCSWPVDSDDGQLSCCAPVHARGWCEPHYKRGVNPAAFGKAKTANDLARSLRKFA